MFENKNPSELEKNILFSEISQDLIAKYSNPKNIIGKREGDVIYQKGDPCEYFYLLIEGIVKLKYTDLDDKNIYIEKNKNSFFGETELLKKTPRKSSAIADTDCRMYSFNLAELKYLIKSNGKVLQNLRDNLTFNIPEQDFEEYTKNFVTKDEPISEFSKTTEKISLDNPVKEEPKLEDKKTEEKIELAEEQVTNTKTEEPDEPAEANISPDDIIIEIEDNSVFDELPEEAEEEHYFQLKDPPKDEEEVQDNQNEKAEDSVKEVTDSLPPTEKQTPEPLTDQPVETEDKSISFDDIITDEDDNIVFDEIPEEENKDYFQIKDPLKEKDKEMDIEFPHGPVIDEHITKEEADQPEKEFKPSFTDIGFGDTIEEEPVEEVPQEKDSADTDKEENQVPEDPVSKANEITQSENNSIRKVKIIEDDFQNPPDITSPEISENDKTSAFYKDIIKRIQNIFSSSNLDEVTNIISEETADLVKAEGAVLYIVDKEEKELVTKILSGTSIHDIRMKFSDGIQGIAASEKRNIFLDNPRQDKYFNPVIEDLTGIKIKNSLYYSFIQNNQETSAVLELYNSERGRFTQTDVEILNEISGSVIKAINRTKLADISIRQKRLLSIGDLTGFISADIKAPLLLVKHYASLIKKKKLSSEINQVLDLQVEQVNAVEEFLDSAEAYSKGKNIVELNTVNIKEALNITLGLLAEYVESRNTVIYRKIESDAVVKLDNGQFYQACYQIVKNACDEMTDEGKIFVTTEKDEEYIKIKFRDNGKGLPENWKEKIFRPFVSRKKNRAGIGLSIAEKIITDHGGYILVDSIIGQGTTFIIALPIVF